MDESESAGLAVVPSIASSTRAMTGSSVPLSARIATLVAASTGRQIDKLELRDNPYESRHHTGLADCLLDSGARLEVFWKEGRLDRYKEVGRLGSVGNEITAYRLLRKVAEPIAPALIGADVSDGEGLLITEYMPSAYRVHKSPIPDALERAAARIGAFHQLVASLVRSRLLDVYSAETYRVWAHRARRARPELAWLARIPERFPPLMKEIQAPSMTIIHGDCYPDNVLVSPELTTTVDWEWAGIGMGEIDLAALTEGWWEERTVAACARAYAVGRGIDPHDPRFQERLKAARLYLHLRWLGGTVQQPINDRTRWRVDAAHSLARSLGLLTENALT